MEELRGMMTRLVVDIENSVTKKENIIELKLLLKNMNQEKTYLE